MLLLRLTFESGESTILNGYTLLEFAVNESDCPKIVRYGLPLFALGTIATIAAAYHDSNNLPIKADDHGHPESPGAPSSRLALPQIAASSTSTASVSAAPIFYYPTR